MAFPPQEIPVPEGNSIGSTEKNPYWIFCTKLNAQDKSRETRQRVKEPFYIVQLCPMRNLENFFQDMLPVFPL